MSEPRNCSRSWASPSSASSSWWPARTSRNRSRRYGWARSGIWTPSVRGPHGPGGPCTSCPRSGHPPLPPAPRLGPVGPARRPDFPAESPAPPGAERIAACDTGRCCWAQSTRGGWALPPEGLGRCHTSGWGVRRHRSHRQRLFRCSSTPGTPSGARPLRRDAAAGTPKEASRECPLSSPARGAQLPPMPRPGPVAVVDDCVHDAAQPLTATAAGPLNEQAGAPGRYTGQAFHPAVTRSRGRAGRLDGLGGGRSACRRRGGLGPGQQGPFSQTRPGPSTGHSTGHESQHDTTSNKGSSGAVDGLRGDRPRVPAHSRQMQRATISRCRRLVLRRRRWTLRCR